MAKRRKARRKRKPETTQGWVWGLFGLGVGLSVAAVIFLNSRTPVSQPAAATPVAKQPPAPVKKDPAEKNQTENEPDKPRFRFYDMLPNFEVVIPEEDADVIPAAKLEAIDQPGVYVLQAGSFSTYGDADGRKAQLAMLGVLAGIQKVTVDNKVYHRVRIGPIDNIDRLNELRRQLRGAQIDAMVIRVGE